MEYVTPIDCGGSDPERAYTDGCKANGELGSITPARFFNLMLAEGRNLVEGAGLTLDPNNDAQWLEAVCALAKAFGSPTGSITVFGAATAPEGWLACDGSEVSRDTFSDLFAVIGETHGAGDGATTFNLPDLRGEFVRGFDNGRGADPGRTFASFQKGSVLAGDGAKAGISVVSAYNNVDSIVSTYNELVNLDPSDGTPLSVSVVNASQTGFAIELGWTRPRNVALLYCIKT